MAAHLPPSAHVRDGVDHAAVEVGQHELVEPRVHARAVAAVPTDTACSAHSFSEKLGALHATRLLDIAYPYSSIGFGAGGFPDSPGPSPL